MRRISSFLLVCRTANIRLETMGFWNVYHYILPYRASKIRIHNFCKTYGCIPNLFQCSFSISDITSRRSLKFINWKAVRLFFYICDNIYFCHGAFYRSNRNSSRINCKSKLSFVMNLWLNLRSLFEGISAHPGSFRFHFSVWIVYISLLIYFFLLR